MLVDLVVPKPLTAILCGRRGGAKASDGYPMGISGGRPRGIKTAVSASGGRSSGTKTSAVVAGLVIPKPLMGVLLTVEAVEKNK